MPKAGLSVARTFGEARRLHQLGQVSDAEHLYKKVLALAPGHAPSLYLLGLAIHARKGPGAADCIQSAIEADPTVTDYHLALAQILADTGQPNAANQCFERAWQLAPNRWDVLVNWGSHCLACNDRVAAADRFQQALVVNPNLVEVRYNLATLLAERQLLDDAEREYRKVVATRPSFAMAWNNLANLLRGQGRMQEARACCLAAIEADTMLPEPLYNLAQFERQSGNLTAANEFLQQAIRLAPTNVEWKFEHAVLLDELGMRQQSIEAFVAFLAENPRHARAHNNLGALLYVAGQVEEANTHFAASLALDPTDVLAYKNYSHGLLLTGQYAEGWRHYLWREGDPSTEMGCTWLGSDPRSWLKARAGQVVDLVPEQGLGDILFFLRYAPLLTAHGLVPRLRDNSPITQMLRRSGIHTQSMDGATLATPIRIGDLPTLFTTHQDSDVPPPLKLEPIHERVTNVAARLAASGPPPYMAVTWEAGLLPKMGRQTLYKRISPLLLGASLRGFGGTVVSVQRGDSASEIRDIHSAYGGVVADFSDLNHDLEDMLAFLSLVDDYVGVSNTNMHLRAGLGKTADVLIPWPPDWRWQLNANRSPWFPEFRVYRQTPREDWGPALACLRQQLGLASSPPPAS